jgi:hypothetical protein
MKKEGRAKPFVIDMSFEEALDRFAKVTPGEIADAVARDVGKQIKEAKSRIKNAREEIDRGARSGKKRFRL